MLIKNCFLTIFTLIDKVVSKYNRLRLHSAVACATDAITNLKYSQTIGQLWSIVYEM